MPALTDLSKPNGLPSTTASDRTAGSLCWNLAAGTLPVDLDQREVRVRIGRHGLPTNATAIGERDLDSGSALDDMVVGER